MVEIYINDESLDLFPDEKVTMTFQVADMANIDTRQGDFSYEFELPKTQKNLRLCKRPDGILAEPYSLIPAVMRSKIEIKRGYLQILGYDGSIQVNFYSGNTNWMAFLGEKRLADLSLTTYDHLFNYTNISGSFSNTEGYIYPYINYGEFTDLNDIDIEDLYTAFYVSTLFRAIFNQLGFKVSGSFLNSVNFKRLVLPFSKSEFANSGAFYVSKNIFVGLSAGQTITTQKINFDLENGIYYNNGLYASPDYTADDYYTVNVQAELPSFATGGTATITLYKDAVVIDQVVTGVGGGQLLSGQTQVEPGDTIFLHISTAGGSGTSTIVAGSTMSILSVQAITEGDIVKVADILPDVRQIELIRYVMICFGVIPVFDEFSQTITFEEFRNIKNNIPEDWSSKISSYDMDYFQFVTNYSRRNKFTYEESDEENLQAYLSKNNRGVGDGEILLGNPYLSGENEIFNTPFSPMWFELSQIGGDEAYLTVTVKEDQPKIMFLLTDVDLDDFANFSTIIINDFSGGYAHNDIPWGWFFKTVIETDLDSYLFNLCFDRPRVDDFVGFSLLERYWNVFAQILERPKMLIAKMKLTIKDIAALDYMTPKYIEAEKITAYYFLNKIKDYDFRDGLYEVELINLDFNIGFSETEASETTFPVEGDFDLDSQIGCLSETAVAINATTSERVQRVWLPYCQVISISVYGASGGGDFTFSLYELEDGEPVTGSPLFQDTVTLGVGKNTVLLGTNITTPDVYAFGVKYIADVMTFDAMVQSSPADACQDHFIHGVQRYASGWQLPEYANPFKFGIDWGSATQLLRSTLLDTQSLNTSIIDSNSERYCQTYKVWKTTRIRKIWIYMESKTGSPTATIQVSMHTLYGGQPSVVHTIGRLFATSLSPSVGWNEYSFPSVGSGYVLTPDTYGIVISREGGTVDGANYWSIRTNTTTISYPYGNGQFFDGVSWSALTKDIFIKVQFEDQ